MRGLFYCFYINKRGYFTHLVIDLFATSGYNIYKEKGSKEYEQGVKFGLRDKLLTLKILLLTLKGYIIKKTLSKKE